MSLNVIAFASQQRQKMKFVVVLAALIAVSYEQTHTTPMGSTHEPSVYASYTFYYEYHTHMMLIIHRRMCYIFTLSDQEKLDVHTDAGLLTLELKFLPLITSGHKTEVKSSSLDINVQHGCGRNTTHFYMMA